MLQDYGNYRNKKFSDIFPNVETFTASYNDNGITPLLNKPASVTTLYYLLYANYGNSTIASSDENRFISALFSIVYMYGPTWEAKLEIQAQVRGLTEDDILLGGKAVYNKAYNPGQEPSTSTLEELDYINEQNTTNFKKSKLEGYAAKWAMLVTDVTKDFIDKFKKLFLIIVTPERPLWYGTEGEEDDG